MKGGRVSFWKIPYLFIIIIIIISCWQHGYISVYKVNKSKESEKKMRLLASGKEVSWNSTWKKIKEINTVKESSALGVWGYFRLFLLAGWRNFMLICLASHQNCQQKLVVWKEVMRFPSCNVSKSVLHCWLYLCSWCERNGNLAVSLD